VRYTMPPDLIHPLPPGTIFPMAHTLKLLEAIKAGKKFYNVTVLDGSDDQGPVEINSFAGLSVKVDRKPVAGEDVDLSLLNTPAWKVRLAFFPLALDEEESDYEMSIVLHENGVISDMEIEYDDFTIAQKLVSIEKADGACKNAPTDRQTKQGQKK
jgi:hypothetical protein